MSWDVQDGKQLGDFAGIGGEIFQLGIENGALFHCAADGRVRQHSLEGRKIVQVYEGFSGRVYSVALHGGTKRIAAGHHDGEVRVWEMEGGRPIVTFSAVPGFVAATK